METNYLFWALNNLMDDAHLIMCPNNDWENIDWMEYPEHLRPSKSDVLNEVDRIKLEEMPRNSYFAARVEAYPPIGDQLDALYHAGLFPPEMEKKIRAVKEAFPKPTGE